tara:strand:- start:104 stop:364 length:261 start_codon:yes stop_codon:yes gene_type:complete
MTPLNTVKKFYNKARSADIHEVFNPKEGWKKIDGNNELKISRLRELAAEGVTVINLNVEDRWGGLRRPDLKIDLFDLKKTTNKKGK